MGDHGYPVTVTIEPESDESSPPNSNATTQHTFLPHERTVVVADVHPTVFNLFNITQQVDSTSRYVSPLGLGTPIYKVYVIAPQWSVWFSGSLFWDRESDRNQTGLV